jgi:hypothetical protein
MFPREVVIAGLQLLVGYNNEIRIIDFSEKMSTAPGTWLLLATMR